MGKSLIERVLLEEIIINDPLHYMDNISTISQPIAIFSALSILFSPFITCVNYATTISSSNVIKNIPDQSELGLTGKQSNMDYYCEE